MILEQLEEFHPVKLPEVQVTDEQGCGVLSAIVGESTSEGS